MKYVIFFLLTASSVHSQMIVAVDSIVRSEMEERRIPGMAVAIIQSGQVIHKQVYGLSVVEHQVPVKPETPFELASLTKQFVATGILMLTQEGRINLDKPIKHYIDSLPTKWQSLTLRQLLSHTAGLTPQDQEYAMLRPWPKYVSKQMMWEAAINDSIFSPPGEVFRYHNSGYFLAELIIENVTGLTYKEFFQKNIFSPLEMKETYFENQIKVIPDQAQGYTIKEDELIKIWRVSQEEMAGGWGIYSSINDLIKWSQALDNNVLLKTDIQKEMFTPIRLNTGDTFHYGLGWYLPQRNGLNYFYHNGQTGPEILKIPNKDLTVIVLSNLGIGLGHVATNEPDPYGIADLIASQVEKEFNFDPKVVPIDINELKKFEGTFEFGYDSHVEFSVKNDQLYIQDSYGFDAMMHIGDGTFTFNNVPPVYYQFTDSNTVMVKEDTWENDLGKRKKK